MSGLGGQGQANKIARPLIYRALSSMGPIQKLLQFSDTLQQTTRFVFLFQNFINVLERNPANSQPYLKLQNINHHNL